jgi:hypothetical protein
MAGSTATDVPEANDGTGTGTFTLLLFASASTYTGTETLVLPAPTTLRGLFRVLENQFPGITDKVLKSSAVTVNLEYVDVDSFGVEDLGRGKGIGEGEEEVSLSRQGQGQGGQGDGGEGGEEMGLDTVIRNGDEVGIIPPVSSG